MNMLIASSVKRRVGMETTGWKRARTQEQIATRISEILEAAGTVFTKVSYDQVTMQMIATEAGFTRSNLYRYYNTREEIFLALYLLDFKQWVNQVRSYFTHALDIEDFVSQWTAILCEQQRYLSLTPLLSISLEKKPPLEIFKQTKETLWYHTQEIIPVLRTTLPFLSYENCLELANAHHVFVSGAWPMGHYSDEQSQVLQNMGYTICSVEFKQFYSKTLKRYVYGLKSEKDLNLE
jgi:AcrR family transcriptional regulator